MGGHGGWTRASRRAVSAPHSRLRLPTASVTDCGYRLPLLVARLGRLGGPPPTRCSHGRVSGRLLHEGRLAGTRGEGREVGGVEADERGRELEEALRLALLRRHLRPPRPREHRTRRHEGGGGGREGGRETWTGLLYRRGGGEGDLYGAGLRLELAPLAGPLPVEAAVAEQLLPHTHPSRPFSRPPRPQHTAGAAAGAGRCAACGE
jgi:hypothetical protein